MPGELEREYGSSIMGEVMHDLGQLAKRPGPLPSMNDAIRLGRARNASRGISDAVLRHYSQLAYYNWRAGRRIRPGDTSQTAGGLFRVGLREGNVGVRIVLTLDYPQGQPAGSKKNVSVLLNVTARLPLHAAILLAQRLFNNGELQFPHDSGRLGVASGGQVVQVISGGWGPGQASWGP